MRSIFSLILGAVLSTVLIAPVAARTIYVPGHRTAKGAYVVPHTRTVPGAPVYRGYLAYPNGHPPIGHPYVAPYAGQAVPTYGYQQPYAPGTVPNPGYVPHVPAPVPVPAAPYYYGR